MQARVNSVLEQLNMPAYPKMPTQEICAQYEELTRSILTLLDLQKQAERLTSTAGTSQP